MDVARDAEGWPLLIGLSGKSKAGKDTAGAHLAVKQGYALVAFADVLKEVVGVAFDLNPEQLWGEKKEQVDPRFGRTPRWLLQHFGTEFRRVWPAVWIHHVRRDVLECLAVNGQRRVAVTDVRFKDEAEALRRMGALLVRIERAGAGAGNHSSETDLDDYDFDMVVSNDNDFEALAANLENLCRASAP